MSEFEIYRGEGQSLSERNRKLPKLETNAGVHDPRGYVASEELRAAVNVAIALGQPLLLTGEPGTGKTGLAYSIAFELELDLLVSHVKTSSSARDLFYRYDALRHFHDSQVRTGASSHDVDVNDYIEYEALGLAILLAGGGGEAGEDDGGTYDDVEAFLPSKLKGKSRPRRSVVLLDEVDKAPRDLPNDILNEIENMEFVVKETGRELRASKEFQPIVLLTSNSERNLPDAFLRRCVFFHLAFPEGDTLRRIINKRLEAGPGLTPEARSNAIRDFDEIRELGLKKNPATAELLAWLKLLARLGIDPGNARDDQRGQLALSYSLLAKTKEDLDLLQARGRDSA